MVRGRSATTITENSRRRRQVSELCRHLRAAIDILEEIASVPVHHGDVAEPATAQPTMLPPATPSAKLAFSIKEASATTGLSRSKLYSLMASGQLASIRIGGRRLIPADAIRALFANGASPI